MAEETKPTPFALWLDEMGWGEHGGRTAAAGALGVTTETIRKLALGQSEPDKTMRLAMAALAAGVKPWTDDEFPAQRRLRYERIAENAGVRVLGSTPLGEIGRGEAIDVLRKLAMCHPSLTAYDIVKDEQVPVFTAEQEAAA